MLFTVVEVWFFFEYIVLFTIYLSYSPAIEVLKKVQWLSDGITTAISFGKGRKICISSLHSYKIV